MNRPMTTFPINFYHLKQEIDPIYIFVGHVSYTQHKTTCFNHTMRKAFTSMMVSYGLLMMKIM